MPTSTCFSAIFCVLRQTCCGKSKKIAVSDHCIHSLFGCMELYSIVWPCLILQGIAWNSCVELPVVVRGPELSWLCRIPWYTRFQDPFLSCSLFFGVLTIRYHLTSTYTVFRLCVTIQIKWRMMPWYVCINACTIEKETVGLIKWHHQWIDICIVYSKICPLSER